jgi:hypothetical protein
MQTHPQPLDQSIQPSDSTECFAVPNSESIIDMIDPRTKLSWINKETLEQIQKRYPDAVITTIGEHLEQKAKSQDTPVGWIEVTEEHWIEMLEILPPMMYDGNSFLVGEPTDHHAETGFPRYSCLTIKNDKHYQSDRPMTIREYNEIK